MKNCCVVLELAKSTIRRVKRLKNKEDRHVDLNLICAGVADTYYSQILTALPKSLNEGAAKKLVNHGDIRTIELDSLKKARAYFRFHELVESLD